MFTSVHTAVCDLVAGRARPLATVTSVKVPSQLFLSNDRRSRSFPPAAHHQEIETAVVVVVGLVQVQAAELVAETGVCRAIGQSAVDIPFKELHRAAASLGGDRDVESAVVVEVVNDDAASRPHRGDTER